MKQIFVFFSIVMILTGCLSNKVEELTLTIGNPTAEDVLQGNPQANIFMYKDTIYIAGVKWADDLSLTKGEQETEIIHQTNVAADFKDRTATQLIVGTKIFRAKERADILIAETEQGDIRFYQLVEG